MFVSGANIRKKGSIIVTYADNDPAVKTQQATNKSFYSILKIMDRFYYLHMCYNLPQARKCSEYTTCTFLFKIIVYLPNISGPKTNHTGKKNYIRCFQY